MRILIVTEVYRPGIGGMQEAIDTLVEGLVAAGDDVTVVTGATGFHLAGFVETVGPSFRIWRMPAVPWIANPKNNRLTVLPSIFLRKFLHHMPKFDVIHMMIPGWWMHLALEKYATKTKTPLVATNHTMPSNMLMNANNWLARSAVNWGEKKTIAFMNRMRAVTSPTKAAVKLQGQITTKKLAISNGVDSSRYLPATSKSSEILKEYGANPNKKSIIFTGRLDGEKRIDLLIDAMKIIGNKYQLLIVGDGLLRRQLIASVKEAGLEDTIYFTGYVESGALGKLLQASDVFAMPSPAELQCISGLEALACGIPVVVADQVALPELTDDGKNGLTFEYPNSNDLAKKLMLLLGDDQRRLSMGKNGRVWIEKNHSVGSVISSYRDLYQSVIDRPFRT